MTELRGFLGNNEGKGSLGFKGERGYSNYQLAVLNGFEGSEQDWLDHFGVDLTGYIKTTDVVDGLTSDSATYPLSAKQGKVLNTSISGLSSGKVNTTDIVDNLTSTATNKVLSANQGSVLKGYTDTNKTAIGTLTNLTTTDKTNLVNAVNEVNDKNILTVSIEDDVTLSTNSDTVLTLSNAETDGVGNKLTFSNGTVTIGAGVSKIIVSATGMYRSLISSVNARYFKIKKNGNEVIAVRNASPSNTVGMTINISPKIIQVQEGDEFTFSIQGISGDVFRGGGWSYFTFEVIE